MGVLRESKRIGPKPRATLQELNTNTFAPRSIGPLGGVRRAPMEAVATMESVTE